MSKIGRTVLCWVAVGVCSIFVHRASGAKFEFLTGPHIASVPMTNPPPFMAPVGCVNVALHKKVTANTNDFRVDLSKITDGAKSYEPDDTVILPKRVRWVQIDLGEQCELCAVVIWHDYTLPDICRGVVVQAADDPEFSVNVRTLFNNDYENVNKLGEGTDLEYYETNFGKLIDAHGVRARYLRFYCRGTRIQSWTWFGTYVEIEAWGLPVDSSKPVEGTNAVPQKLAPLPLKVPPAPFW